MRINNFQYEVMSAKRYPLTPYGDIIGIIYIYLSVYDKRTFSKKCATILNHVKFDCILRLLFD